MEIHPPKDKITTIFIDWVILFVLLVISYTPIHSLSEAAGERNIPKEAYNEFYFICSFVIIISYILYNWRVKVVSFDDDKCLLKITVYNLISLEHKLSIKYSTLIYKIAARMYEGKTLILYSSNKKKKTISVSDVGGEENFNKIKTHLDELGIERKDKK